MTVKIEKGIPLTRKWASNSRYDFGLFEIGDSALYETESAVPACYKYAVESGKKFVTRKSKDGKGWRIWRVG